MAGRKAKTYDAWGITVTYKSLGEILKMNTYSVGIELNQRFKGNAERFLEYHGIADEMQLRIELDKVEEQKAIDKICGVIAGEPVAAEEAAEEAAEVGPEEKEEEKDMPNVEQAVEERTEERMAEIEEKLLLKRFNQIERLVNDPKFIEEFQDMGVVGAFLTELRKTRLSRFMYMIENSINWEEFEK